MTMKIRTNERVDVPPVKNSLDFPFGHVSFGGSVNFWALWITYLNKKNMLPPRNSLFRSSNPGRWEAVGHATDC